MQRESIFTEHVKKAVVSCFVMLLCHLYSSAQFSFHVFPMGVIGDAYADTMLNTRVILVKAGIRKIEAYQTLPQVTKTFATKTMNFDKTGYLNKVTVCFAKNDSSNFTLCIDDTISYDHSGKIVAVETVDNKRNKYPRRQIEYLEGTKTNNSSVEKSLGDSLVVYNSYNDKGQLVNLRRIWKRQEIENTAFYYNPDGLLDSTRNTYWGTFVFSRRKKGKDKLIEMTNSIASYRWVYNLSGRCVTGFITVKDRPDIMREPEHKGDWKTKISYYYNENGTLSKVVNKSDNKPAFTMYYSYF